jgi:hypothetical protein
MAPPRYIVTVCARTAAVPRRPAAVRIIVFLRKEERIKDGYTKKSLTPGYQEQDKYKKLKPEL